MKAYENRYASFTMQVYNAVFTAAYNINRKKGRKALNPLRKIPKKADIEKLEVVIDTFNAIVSVCGKSWTEKILAANGLKKGER